MESITVMPEGHTIHRIARDHKKWFAGQLTGLCSPQGRFEKEAKKLDGSILRDVTAHGKHLFYHWSPGKIVHVHLGLYGKFRVHKNPAPQPRGAVRMRVIGRDRSFDLNGPTCCELINTKQHQAIKSRLGQDPLRADACPETLWLRISRSRSAIGTLMLNQAVIAGVGNVYRAEILFLLAIHPETPANKLSRKQFNELWKLTVGLLTTGVKYNRIITMHPEIIDKPPGRLKASERLHVYKRTNCRQCGSKIRTWLLGNRKMYACLKCQKK
jgi:endonuclease-8